MRVHYISVQTADVLRAHYLPRLPVEKRGDYGKRMRVFVEKDDYRANNRVLDRYDQVQLSDYGAVQTHLEPGVIRCIELMSSRWGSLNTMRRMSLKVKKFPAMGKRRV